MRLSKQNWLRICRVKRIGDYDLNPYMARRLKQNLERAESNDKHRLGRQSPMYRIG
jgi:hypothetical protein